MLGFTMALSASRQLQRIFAALIGSERRRDDSRHGKTTFSPAGKNNSDEYISNAAR